MQQLHRLPCVSGQVGHSQRQVLVRTATKDHVAATNGSSNGTSHIADPATGSHKQAASQSTMAVHAGERSGRQRVGDSLTQPIVQTSTYFFTNTQEVIDFNEGRLESNEYGRYGNPTTKACEEKIKALEGAEDCLVSASGMNSVTSMLLALVPAGGHIITTNDCYWRTRQFMQNFLPKVSVCAVPLYCACAKSAGISMQLR